MFKSNAKTTSVVFVKGQLNDISERAEIQSKSSNSAFEFVNHPISNSEDTDSHRNAFCPIGSDSLGLYFDKDGRVVHEAKLREALYYGGCTSSVRHKTWTFIFGLYPMMSTQRERKELDLQNYFRYQALKKKCFEFLKTSDCEFQTEQSEDTFVGSDKSIYSTISRSVVDTRKNMAEIYAGNQSFDLASVDDWYRVIDKDIPRTDTDHQFFEESKQTKLNSMRNILITFGFFHPKTGYVQGMNDILARFMVVLESEVDAYWCFSNYMESMESNFDETGMIEKIDHVRSLLQELEPNLFSHFCACSVPDLMFVHRWLLVSFKREFNYEESIQCFEILQSGHLKFDSHAALTTQNEQHRIEVMKNKGKTVSTPDFSKIKYTLEIFVCVSMIMLKRQEFLACTDAADVFDVACNLRGTLNLRKVHEKACGLFMKYCRKYVKDEYSKEEKRTIFQSMVKSLQSLPFKRLSFHS